MNKYLSYGRERAPKVKEMFTRLAWRYDVVNDVMSFGLHRLWKRQTVQIALDGGRRRFLDLCCGTGDLCFLAGKSGARRVTGLDFTMPMLAVALRRRSAEGPGTELIEGDALSLPFPDGSFDAITSAYGLRNIADPAAALVEMRRVVAPGGRVVILDFGKPDNRVAASLYGAFLHTMMPFVGWLFHRDPETYLYIPASLERYPGQRGVADLMERAGFVNVRYENRLFGTMGINIGEAPV